MRPTGRQNHRYRPAGRELAQHQTGSNINRLNLICAQEMLDVSNVIFHEHYSEYITKIVVPSLSQLLADHVGGAIWSIPYSIILAAGLVMLLLFIDPWIAAWGATITMLHLGLVATLAAMVGPYSYYFLRDFRGLALSKRSTLATSAFEIVEKSVPFGKKSRIRPLVFSFKPRSHA
jgi:hypothetical protein